MKARKIVLVTLAVILAACLLIVLPGKPNMETANQSGGHTNIVNQSNRGNRSREFRGKTDAFEKEHLILPRTSVELTQFIASLESSGESDMSRLYQIAVGFQGEERQLAIQLLGRRWSGLNPVGAAEFSKSIRDYSEAERFLTVILAMWPQQYLAKGFEWVATISDAAQRQGALEVLFSGAVHTNPVLASQYVELLPEGNKKISLVNQLAVAWCKADQEAAINWVVKSLTEASRAEALFAIGSTIAKSDPQTALNLLEMLPFGSSRDNLLSSVAACWVSQDSKAAIGWFASLEPADQNLVANAMAAPWAHADPLSAVAFGLGLPDDKKQKFLSLVVAEWGREDRQSALNWIKESDFPVSSEMAKGLFGPWAAGNPQDAASHINEFSETLRPVITREVIMNWAASSPEAAAAFAKSLPEGESRVEAVSMAVVRWVRSDSLSASKWLSTIEPGEARDRGIIELSFAISETDPKSGFDWATQIDNPIERTKWIQKLGNQWIMAKGGAAVDEISKMQLSSSDLKLLNIK